MEKPCQHCGTMVDSKSLRRHERACNNTMTDKEKAHQDLIRTSPHYLAARKEVRDAKTNLPKSYLELLEEQVAADRKRLGQWIVDKVTPSKPFSAKCQITRRRNGRFVASYFFRHIGRVYGTGATPDAAVKAVASNFMEA